MRIHTGDTGREYLGATNYLECHQRDRKVYIVFPI